MIQEVAKSAAELSGTVKLTSNFVQLNFSPCNVFQYRTNFEFKDVAADVKGDKWKLDLQRKLLSKVFEGCSQEERKKEDLVICLGQTILSPFKLPRESISEELCIREKVGRTISDRRFVVSMALHDEPVDLSKNPDWFVINNVVDFAFKTIFSQRSGPKLVDLSTRENKGSGIWISRGVIPTAAMTTIEGKPTPVVQVSPALCVGSSKSAHEGMQQILRSIKEQKKAESEICERYTGKKACAFHGKVGTIYKMRSVNFKTTVDDTFGCKSDSTMTYRRYFKERYSLELIQAQYFVECRQTDRKGGKPVQVPSQLLFPLDLDQEQKSKLPQMCSIFANDRVNRINDILQRMKGPGAKVLEAFGLSIGDVPLKVDGRVLPSTEVLIPNGPNNFMTVNTGLPGNQEQLGFARDLGRLCFKAPSSTPYTLVSFVEQRHDRDRQQVATEIQNNLRSYQSESTIKEIKKIISNGDVVGDMVRDVGKYNADDSVFLVHLDRKLTDPYKEIKSELGIKGFVSQVIAQKHEKPPVLKMIAQQVNAKLGSLNWIVDLEKSCPSLKGKGLLLVGVDISQGLKSSTSHGNLQRAQHIVVAFVAFYVRDKKWSHYCNHYVESGAKQTIYRDEDDKAEAETTASGASGRSDPATFVSKHLGEFLLDARAHFEKLGPIHNIIVARGGQSDGEIAKCEQNEVSTAKQIATSMNCNLTYVGAQRRNNTRFFFNASETLRGAGVPKGFVNAPRGFVTKEGIGSKSGFYVTGANCTLGQAKSTKFTVMFDSSEGKLELESLFFALGFMFPNKPDAIPYPLPLQCASRYANLFVLLHLGSATTLPVTLRRRMHYL